MLTRTLIGLTSALCSTLLVAQELDAYGAFQQALGEPAWIGAAADHPLATTAFRPIPPLESFPATAAKRDLGFTLFHDARLSKDGTVACNTCHMGMQGGADGLSVSRGVGGLTGPRNTPTVFNAAFNFRQFWDGRSPDLATQTLEPITNPVEMGHDLDAVLELLANDAEYSAKFAAVYPDGVTAPNLGDALGQHVKDMTRTDSRFNAYLSGNTGALTEQELRGLERFRAAGCASCHNGINVGGNSYQKLGIANEFPSADAGLFARSGRDTDRGVFKVPSLHNVALTAPYFHDGSVATLEQAVSRMAELESGRTLDDAEVADIVAFLGSLSSEFFGGMAPHMDNESIRGEMRQQLQHMDHSGQQGQGQHVMNHGDSHDHAMMNHNASQAPQAPQAHAEHAMPAEAAVEDHAEAYAQALANVLEAEGRIVAEMNRIDRAEVAHYDFLQHEYTELLRHVSALRHPPAELDVGQRLAVIEQAEALVKVAESLEWIIADFVRAEAVLGSARSNQQDLLARPERSDADNTALATQQRLLDQYADVPAATIARLLQAGVRESALSLEMNYR